MNKRAQLTIIAIIVGALIIGSVIFFTQFAKAEPLTRDDIQKIIDELPDANIPDEIRDADPDTSPPGSNVGNTPPAEIPEICTISGKWTKIWIKEKTSFDESAKGVFGHNIPRAKAFVEFTYTGNCVTDVYIESAYEPGSKKSLSAIPIIPSRGSTPSLCDASTRYYGALCTNVDPADRLTVLLLRPETPLEEGTWSLKIGAYTGCVGAKIVPSAIKEGGTTIREDFFPVKISDERYQNPFNEIFETQTATQSWRQLV